MTRLFPSCPQLLRSFYLLLHHSSTCGRIPEEASDLKIGFSQSRTDLGCLRMNSSAATAMVRRCQLEEEEWRNYRTLSGSRKSQECGNKAAQPNKVNFQLPWEG
ncbi:uncharacterized protein LOC118146411 [Callithrix jacchus]